MDISNIEFNRHYSISGYYRYRDVLKNKISIEEYRLLKEYSDSNNVLLSNFRDYTGDINIIEKYIDAISIVSKDFPKICNGRSKVGLNLHFDDSDEYAGTDGRIITLNGLVYNDSSILEQNYFNLVRDGFFVQGTTYLDIIYHELGHVVSNVYHLDALLIAKEAFGLDSVPKIIIKARNELSLYSVNTYNSIITGRAEFDGSELIAECFCGYYSKSGNEFAKKYVDMCKDIIMKEEV